MIRDRHYSPEYAVSRTLRRYAKVFQTCRAASLADRAGDIFDIEKRLLRQLARPASRGALAAHVARRDSGPQSNAQRNGQSRSQVRPRIRHRSRRAGQPHGDRRRGARIAGRRRHRSVSQRCCRRRSGHYRRRSRVWSFCNPTPRPIAQYRAQVEQNQRTAAVQLDDASRSAGRNGRRGADRADGQHRVPARSRAIASSAAPTASGFIAPNSSISRPNASRPRKITFKPTRASFRRWAIGPVVIRTLDLGADKCCRNARADDERNPFLGLRSIRLSLRNMPLFRTQLRAILRASALGNLHVMFPLITTIQEFRQREDGAVRRDGGSRGSASSVQSRNSRSA